MTTFDIIVYSILGLSVIFSLFKGFVKEIFSLLSYLGGYLMASKYQGVFSNVLMESIPSKPIANLIAFTTGRGSCFGAKPTPSIKLATNSNLYERMTEDMDINCGAVIDGEKNIEEMGKEIFEEFISFASGKKTKSEVLNLGRHEFAPWQIGITG